MSVTMELKGRQQVERMLRNVPEKYAKKALRKGLRAGAKIITRRTKARARSDLKTHEKNLIAKSIKTRATKRSRRFIGMTTTLGAGFFKGDTFYGAFVELGHYAGKRRGGKETRQQARGRKRVEGVHFMEKAANDVKDRAGRKAVIVTRRELLAQVAAGG